MTPQDICTGFNLSIDQGIASSVGIDAALIFNHIIYWLRINASKPNAEMIDGKYWMYETNKQMSDFFGFLSEDQISRGIRKLKDAKLIQVEKFGKNPFDHTSWFTVYDQELVKKSLRNPQICGIDKRKSAGSDSADLRVSTYTTTKETEVKKQQQQSVVVVSANAGAAKNKQEDSKIVKDDVHAFAMRNKKDWSFEEIEKTWTLYVESKYPISNPLAYIEGIINKQRITEKLQSEKKTCPSSKKNQKPLISSLEKPKEPCSVKDLSEHPLHKLVSMTPIPEKYKNL
jgi:hypothetical protein